MPARLALALALALAGCTPHDPDPARAPALPAASSALAQGARPPAASVAAPASPPAAAASAGPAAQLDCPPGHDHGCSFVARIPLLGGGAEILLLEWARPGPLAVAGGELYFVGSMSFSSITAHPLVAADPAARWAALRLVDWPGGRIRDLELAGDAILLVAEDAVYTVPARGKGAARRLDATGGAFFGAVGAGWAVWSIDESGGRREDAIRGVRLAGGAPQTLAAGEHNPQDVAVDEDGVFWLAWGEGEGNPPGSVRHLPHGSREPVTLAAGEVWPRAIATDATAVFWVAESRKGRALHRVSKAGGAVSELVPTTGRVGVRGNQDQALVAGGWVLFNAGDAIWRVRPDGSGAAPVATVAAGADIVRFTVDAGQIYAGVSVYDPSPRMSLP